MNSISRKAALVLSALAIVSLPLGMMAARAHTQTYKTNMSIHFDKHDDEVWGHLGTSSFCQQGRDVEIFKDGSSIGTVVSAHAGMWSIPSQGAGTYHAVAAESHSTGYDHDHTCLEGTSKSLTVG